MDIARWVLAAEYDEQAFTRLGEALRSLGYQLQDQWQGVAGSQDVAHWQVSGPNGSLTVESETYIGLSVEGKCRLVDLLRTRYEQLPSNQSFEPTPFGATEFKR